MHVFPESNAPNGDKKNRRTAREGHNPRLDGLRPTLCAAPKSGFAPLNSSPSVERSRTRFRSHTRDRVRTRAHTHTHAILHTTTVSRGDVSESPLCVWRAATRLQLSANAPGPDRVPCLAEDKRGG